MEHRSEKGSTRRLFVMTVLALALLVVACGGGGQVTEEREERRVAQAGSTVSVHYRGTLDSGEEFDSSYSREPLTFEVGAGEVIPGFDEAVAGMAEGERKAVRLEPDQAYGDRRDDLVISVPANQAPEGLEVGQQVRLGEAPATVVDVGDSEVTVDANHPLAGQALNFEIELVAVE